MSEWISVKDQKPISGNLMVDGCGNITFPKTVEQIGVGEDALYFDLSTVRRVFGTNNDFKLREKGIKLVDHKELAITYWLPVPKTPYEYENPFEAVEYAAGGSI